MQNPKVQDEPGGQVPHEPPHPSSPHSLKKQSGSQSPLHLPDHESHVSPYGHEPQDPPHPSGPHSLPQQSFSHEPPHEPHWPHLSTQIESHSSVQQ
jgi:hypothetical protein